VNFLPASRHSGCFSFSFFVRAHPSPLALAVDSTARSARVPTSRPQLPRLDTGHTHAKAWAKPATTRRGGLPALGLPPRWSVHECAAFAPEHGPPVRGLVTHWRICCGMRNEVRDARDTVASRHIHEAPVTRISVLLPAVISEGVCPGDQPKTRRHVDTSSPGHRSWRCGQLSSLDHTGRTDPTGPVQSGLLKAPSTRTRGRRPTRWE